jgi:hypothetical protein
MGLILLLLITVAAFYADLLVGSGGFAASAPSPASFAVLFLLAALVTFRPIGRVLRFSRAELLSIYAIVLGGAPLVSYGILGFLIPNPIYMIYGGRKYPEWANAFGQLIPLWYTPTETNAVENFFQGGTPVPWSLWYVPLVAWCSVLLALLIASTCLVMLVQRQWITNERLAFPLAQIPLESVMEGEHGARLPVAKAFWIGFLLSFTVQVWNGLAGIFPSLPAVPLGPVTVVPAYQTGPLAAMGDLEIVLWPWMIAIAYLIPKELSFSAWVFYIIRVVMAAIAITFGAQPRSATGWLGDTAFPAFAFQGLGSVLALSFWAAWKARRHLSRAVRVAFSREAGTADAQEPLPYRWAIFGFLLSFGWLIAFFVLSGGRAIVGIGLFTVILCFYMMWNWLRAETGLAMLLFPSFVDDQMDGFGNARYRPQEIITICVLRWTFFPGSSSTPDVVSGSVLESMKIANQARISARPLFRAMAIGIVLALVLGAYVTLTGMYHYGFYNLRAANQSWLSSQVNWSSGHIFSALSNPSKLDWNAVAGVGAGAVVALGLGLLRARFWWWPLHPVGYLAANCWGMHWFYMPFFVGWLGKSLVTRYGGLRLYRQTVPLAIGLIAGSMMDQMVWTIYHIVMYGRT